VSANDYRAFDLLESGSEIVCSDRGLAEFVSADSGTSDLFESGFELVCFDRRFVGRAFAAGKE
jgi:hypothetical protein